MPVCWVCHCDAKFVSLFFYPVLTPDPMTTSVAANLLEMGFTQERAREAILTVRRLRGMLIYCISIFLLRDVT